MKGKITPFMCCLNDIEFLVYTVLQTLLNCVIKMSQNMLNSVQFMEFLQFMQFRWELLQYIVSFTKIVFYEIIKSINYFIIIFRHFKCVEFMSEITNCMLSSYNVLPGQPRNFKFSNVGTNIGILHWDEPFEHKDTIDGYRVTYTLIQPGSRGNSEKQTKISSRYRTYFTLFKSFSSNKPS